MPPPTQALNQSQNQNLNPNPNTLGHQRQRSLQDSQRGVGDGHTVVIMAPPEVVYREPKSELDESDAFWSSESQYTSARPESQGGRRGWQGIFSWSGLDPNTQERKEVQTMVSAVFPDEARVNQARPETWPTNLTLHPTTDRAVSQLELRAWLARFTPGLCTFQSVPQDARQNEVNFRSLISLLLAKNIRPPEPPELHEPDAPAVRPDDARAAAELHARGQAEAAAVAAAGQQQGQGFAPPNMMNMQGAGIPLMGGMAAMAGKPGGGFPGAAGMAGVQPGLANMMQRFGLPPGSQLPPDHPMGGPNPTNNSDGRKSPVCLTTCQKENSVQIAHSVTSSQMMRFVNFHPFPPHPSGWNFQGTQQLSSTPGVLMYHMH
ncbi:hypothetical protein IMY05_C4504000500 [Salix suchowensis]|nr:hypothetical protein IMY05_C4504000500 [Salix suchowensis]